MNAEQKGAIREIVRDIVASCEPNYNITISVKKLMKGIEIEFIKELNSIFETNSIIPELEGRAVIRKVENPNIKHYPKELAVDYIQKTLHGRIKVIWE